MKAFLLAAGEGRRLRPLTLHVPKCLLPIHGKPLLEIWLNNCERAGIDEVLINAHYLADQIKNYLRDNKNKFRIKIKYVFERKLKGTGGTIRDNFDFVKNEKLFFIFHADNYTNINLKEFKDFHLEHKSPLTISLFYTKNPKQCGIVESIDDRGLVTAFREKPKNPKSNLASAAMFVASTQIKKYFPKKKAFDFSQEVLPKYIGEMHGYLIKGFNIDIGTIKNYRYVQKIRSKNM